MLSTTVTDDDPNDSPSVYLRALVVELAVVMERRVYRRHMHPLLSARQKAHLWALRNQALFGDAPEEDEAEAGEKAEKGKNDATKPSQEEESSAASVGAGGDASDGASRVKTELSPNGLHIPKRPHHWYQFTERFHYEGWVALRGLMSPQVAAEAFCTEFFHLLRLHHSPAMLPVMESVLCTARAKATAASSTNPIPTTNAAHAHHPNSALGAAGVGLTSARRKMRPLPQEGFLLRGCNEDPVVIAFLWLCRAHCIPCEVRFEPLAALRDAQDVFLVRSIRYGTVVTDPIAAFTLCVEMYMPLGEHWLGVLPPSSSRYKIQGSNVNKHERENSNNEGVTHRVRLAIERSLWAEHMQHIASDLRTPFLRYICAVQRNKNDATFPEKSEPLQQQEEPTRLSIPALTRAAANMNAVQQQNELAQAVLRGLTRYERFATHYYTTRPPSSHSLVSVTELCVAAFGFLLCTSPHSDGILPLTAAAEIPARWSQCGSLYTNRPPIPPRAPNATAGVLCAGIPPTCQETARRLLEGQTALAQTASPVSLGPTCRGESDANGVWRFRVLSFHSTGRAVCEAAVEAVAAMLRVKCGRQRYPLAKLLADAWGAGNEQCVGFPFLVLDREQEVFLTSPTNHGAGRSRGHASPSSGHGSPLGEDGMAVAKAYWEKLRIVFGAAPSPPCESRTYQSHTSHL